jgi:PAS domain S-box-containing protein
VDHGRRSHRKRPSEVVAPLRNRADGVDYEEIFAMSNVPQLIATTSGKVVAWNKCFIKATGIRRSEVERMTIFSLVKPDQLSKFFEIVSQVLKVDEGGEEASGSDTSESGQAKELTSNNTPIEAKPDYAAMTLPCIDFPAAKRRREIESSSFGRLYVTVSNLIFGVDTFAASISTHELVSLQLTLMTNVDARKRCFHCVFTNHPRSDGVLGILSPQLLASMYNGHDHSCKRQKRLRRHSTNHRSRSKAKFSPGEIPSAIEQNRGMACSGKGRSDDTITEQA